MRHGLVTRFYDHLVTTLTYGKYIISIDMITHTTLSPSQRIQSVVKGIQGEDVYVKEDQDHERKKNKACFGKKRSKSKNLKIT